MKRTDPIESVLKSKPRNRVLSVTPDQSVYEAIQKMAENRWARCSSFPRANWLASSRSVTTPVRSSLKGHSSRETKVHEIMTSPVIFVTPQHTVDECMAIMSDGRLAICRCWRTSG